MRNKNEKNLAIIYRKQGKSYNMIAQDLAIPKSTLASWFKDLKWSQEIRQCLAKEAARKIIPKLLLMNEVNKLK